LEIRQKAEGYLIPNERVDGMDVMKVYEAGKKAIEHIRAGNGPYLLEFVTYRYMGHSMGDPERYREKQEVEKWREDDPIGIFRKTLQAKRVAAKTLDEIEARASQDMEKAVEFAEASPEPAPEELWTNVYVE